MPETMTRRDLVLAAGSVLTGMAAGAGAANLMETPGRPSIGTPSKPTELERGGAAMPGDTHPIYDIRPENRNLIIGDSLAHFWSVSGFDKIAQAGATLNHVTAICAASPAAFQDKSYRRVFVLAGTADSCTPTPFVEFTADELSTFYTELGKNVERTRAERDTGRAMDSDALLVSGMKQFAGSLTREAKLEQSTRDFSALIRLVEGKFHGELKVAGPFPFDEVKNLDLVTAIHDYLRSSYPAEYVDAARHFFDEYGRILDAANFREDKIHLSRQGYLRLAEVLAETA